MIKSRILLTFLILAYLLSGIIVFSQEPPVIARSKDKVVIEGKVYYIHIVKKGETLFSISKAYNVPQKDIIIENPAAQTGLQVDQALKIPFVPESEHLVLAEDGDYIIHRVEQGQTLFSLSRFYNVTVEEIVALNPGVEEVMKIGEHVRIPKKSITPQREGFPEEDDEFLYHKVAKGETLFSLSKRYNVEIRDIRRANRKLIWGLKAGEFIRIPKTPDFIGDEDVLAEVVSDTLVVDEPVVDSLYFMDIVPDPLCAEFDYLTEGRPYHVVLFLPLFIERNFPSEDVEEDEQTAGQRQPAPRLSVPDLLPGTIPYLEFYEGALLAIDSLKKQGLSLNLFVYDSERNPAKIHETLQDLEYRDIDLIIGPFFPEEVLVVSEFAKNRNIPIVTPVTTRQEFVFNNPYLYQITPSVRTELEMASLFVANYPAHNIVIVRNDDPLEIENAQKMKDFLFSHFSMKNEFDQVVIKEIIYSDSLNIHLEQSLNKAVENIVILTSKEQAFVADLVNRLNILSTMFPLNVVGMHEWGRFTYVNVEFFHNLQLHYSSPFFVDYSNPEVRQFLKSFRHRYKAEPEEYGFLGFDTFYYFLSAMKTFGPDFKNCLPYLQVKLTQGDFLFRKISEYGGFENHGLSIIRYNKDYTIVKLNGPMDLRRIARQ
jgi:LysM repeat protein